MSMPHITSTTVETFDAVQIENGALAFTIIPELGGKISSLRDLRSGREWLWRHPRMAYQRVPHGSSYITEADTGGWDECFPSVTACVYPAPPWEGAAIQDHGELWSQTAQLEVEESSGAVTLHTRWQGVALPYTFARAITLGEEASLRVEYTATGMADAPLHFIWSIHPLLAIEPGMQLLLPPAARFNCWAATPADLLAQNAGLLFPMTVNVGEQEIDLSTLPDETSGIGLKLWSEPLAAGDGWATLRASDGELRMHWDTALLPQVGFWLNAGAVSGDGGAPYYNFALEPCIGAQDSLADAVTKHNLFETLPPRGSRSWWLEVAL